MNLLKAMVGLALGRAIDAVEHHVCKAPTMLSRQPPTRAMDGALDATWDNESARTVYGPSNQAHLALMRAAAEHRGNGNLGLAKAHEDAATMLDGLVAAEMRALATVTAPTVRPPATAAEGSR